jgi:transposase
MSLPELELQRSFFDADQVFRPLAKLPGAERFVFFAERIWPALVALRPRLAAMYCHNNGRPAEEPVRMLGVLILQFMERMPDRQAAEVMTYDLRWKIALGLRADATGCHPTSLVKFRNRLLRHGLENLGFDGVLEAMRQAGYLPKKGRQRLDSTHILGLVSDMSRLECLRETLRLAIQALATVEALARPEAWTLWFERYVESQVDYRTPLPALKAKMDQAGRDAQELLAWVEALRLPAPVQETVDLLRRVFAENFEVQDLGPVQRPAQPPGAVHNPHDPEAQWCKKSTIKHREWVGYKVQIAETVGETTCRRGEPTAAVLTAVVTQPATSSDKAALGAVETAWEATEQAKPESLYVDAGYTSGEEIARAQAEGRTLHGPVQPPPHRGGRFGSDAFDVQVESRTAICPAGCASTQCSSLTEASTGRVAYRFEWSTACRSCALRSGCVAPDQPHRTLTVGEHHTLIQTRRRAMKTEAFAHDMQRRNGIEGTISELVRAYRLRRARYRGLFKMRLQTFLIAAACNLRRWCRRLAWLRAGGPTATGRFPVPA